MVVIPTMENAYHNLKDFVSIPPPIGLLSIAAVAIRNGYEVTIIDGDAEGLSTEQIISKIVEINPAIVGATIMTATIEIAKMFFTLVKNSLPDACVIVGGPHSSALPEKTLVDLPAVDIVVVGEGDYTIIDILQALEKNDNLLNIAGIAFRHNNEIIRTIPRIPLQDLSALPTPAFHLLKKHLYRPYGWSRWPSGIDGPLGVIFTTRGCIGKCNFCASKTVFGDGPRNFSMQQVIEQLEFLVHEWNIRILYIQDDTFTLNSKRVEELCDYIISKGYNKRLEIQVSSRVNTINPAMLKKMREAGVRWIFFGIESGNQEILNKMDKNITLKSIREAIRIAKQAKLFIGGNYIIGSIGETRETAMDTINLACELDQDYASFSTAIPLPGTGLYQHCLDNNIPLPAWNDFGNVNTPPISLNKNMTAADLYELRDCAVSRFFKRPSYFLKLLFRMRAFVVIKDFIKMYLAIRKEKAEKRF